MRQAMTSLALLFVFTKLIAQCPANITFTSQPQIDSFPIVYPNCQSIEGDVAISHTEITDLSGLQNITAINGNFYMFYNTDLTSLSGLNNLSSVGGDFNLTGNELLTDLSGLENLKTVGQTLKISSSNNLASLNGLEGLNQVGYLWIRNSFNLTNLNGLDNLASIDSSLIIETCHGLENLNGMHALKKIGKEIRLSSNNSLSSLTAISAIDTLGGVKLVYLPSLGTIEGIAPKDSTIHGDLTISTCYLLTDIGAVSNIKSIENSLLLDDLPNVTDYSGLENIDSLGTLAAYELNHLTNFLALASLKHIRESIILKWMPALQNLTGLEQVTTLEENVVIQQCGSMISFDGLNNLTAIGEGLLLERLNSLNNLEGLDQLKNVGGDIKIERLESLVSFAGLGSLETVGGDFVIERNDDLTSFAGLDQLLSIAEILIIDANKTLIDLSALQNLSEIGVGLFVWDNVSLPSLTGLENVHQTDTCLISITDNGLKSLEGLNGMTSVRDLTIYNNDSLTNLSGLNNLEMVGERGISIRRNDALLDLSGLEKLSKVTGDFHIHENERLANISALGELTTVGESLSIVNNPMLSSLNGLEKINHIDGGSLSIMNSDIKNMEGLNGLISTQWLYVRQNPRLKDFSGFENLKFINGDLEITDNDSLVTLSGLDNISSVNGDLLIYYNDILPDLYGLENLTEVTGEVNVGANASLANCNVFPVCQAVINGTAVINGNDAGCDNTDEVVLTCDDVFDFSHISGKVFIDFNCNGIFETQDILSPFHILRNTDDTPFATTDLAGNYDRLLFRNTTYDFYAPPMMGYSSFPANYSINTDSTSQMYPATDFNICPDSLFSNLRVTLEPLSVVRPGFESHFHICFENRGTQKESAILHVHFDNDFADEITITDAANGVVANNAISWEIDSLPLFQTECFHISFKLSPDVSIGSALQVDAQIELTNGNTDIDLTDNFDSNTLTVVGSFDPNDKTVNQSGIEHMDSLGKIRLEYLIRFQNTGTYPATFVEVLDTIQDFLDMRSFEMITSSHHYNLSFPEENIIKWRFDDINLADSTSNEAESHGFILFSIETFPDLNLTDVIQNRAAIYFDYNEPIITNYAVTNFFVDTKEKENKESLKLTVFPNPSTPDNLNLLVRLKKPAHGEISLINTIGQIASTQTFDLGSGLNNLKLKLGNVSPGIYFLSFSCDQGEGTVKVLIR